MFFFLPSFLSNPFTCPTPRMSGWHSRSGGRTAPTIPRRPLATGALRNLMIVERDIGRPRPNTPSHGRAGDRLSLSLNVPPWEDSARTVAGGIAPHHLGTDRLGCRGSSATRRTAPLCLWCELTTAKPLAGSLCEQSVRRLRQILRPVITSPRRPEALVPSRQHRRLRPRPSSGR